VTMKSKLVCPPAGGTQVSILYYDISMFGKRFEKELALVEAALASEKGEKEIRKYLSPLVNSLVEKYLSEHKGQYFDKEGLVEAGWTHLHQAMKHYRRRAELMQKGKNDVFYFSTYFNWYVRQGILEYVNSSKSENEK
jgi:hypothetical protein